MSLFCANGHEASRMVGKGPGKFPVWNIFSCPTCQGRIEVVGNGLYCGRDGERMKRIGSRFWCPACGLEARVQKTLRPTMDGLDPLRPRALAKPTPAAPPPAAPPKPAAPTITFPPSIDVKAAEAIMKLVDMKGSADLSTVKSILKLRLKQEEPDVQGYAKALAGTGRYKLEGNQIIKAA